ncbi:MAG: DNA repair protein RadA [Candidatus Sericytochromatia bacterium]|nr:DNA repair protein RadA [Candidatus Tanganyikabacteria bacterium]
MPKVRTRFVCQECGDVKPRGLGRCPECGGWNTYVEEADQPRGGSDVPATMRVAPEPIAAAALTERPRLESGLAELDRVLGGGIVPGSLVLLGGEPGAGKSTLTMQVSHALARAGHRVLYVTGEESIAQVRLRAARLGVDAPGMLVLAETDLDCILEAVSAGKPDWVVIDSIQAVHDPRLASAPGSVSQVREATAQVMRVAKHAGPAVCLVGHVTKEGTLAGPRVLEHMVDTVLSFEGDRFRTYRLLRAVKNRFGSTQEVGVFEMTGGGLREVANPSALFLAERAPDATGSAIAVPMEGTRPLLVEVQALVAPTFMAAPRRAANGVDVSRLVQILAVLERRVGFKLSRADVYASVVGGLEVAEPAADLAIALAVASGMRDRALPPDLVAIGEIGLGGEVRSVAQAGARLREAWKLGFKRAVLPAGNMEELAAPPGMVLAPVSRLVDALVAGLGTMPAGDSEQLSLDEAEPTAPF